MSNCNCHKETIRDGSGQLTRYLKALDPAYAPIDDRSLEDLLVFIKTYASRIRFYDVPESQIVDGTASDKVSWADFFEKDIAVIAASVGLTDVTGLKQKYDKNRTSLESAPSGEALALLFQHSITIALLFNHWHALSISTNPFYQDIELAIHSVLADNLQKVMAYEAGYNLVDPSKPLGLEYEALDDNELWGTDDTISPDVSIYAGGSTEEKILNAALFADEVFNSCLASLNNLVGKSDSYFQFALTQYPNHQPQMALFIAFLQLFQLAQQQMNGLTAKMLDFYYRDVLQLTPKDALPDKVHVVFELAKNVVEYDLAPGTMLKGGKDNAGVEQVYTTNDDLVVNQAKIAEIKTVFIDKEAGDSESVIQTVYANPVANSADGLGAPFENPAEARWATFGLSPTPEIGTDPICEIIGKLKDENEIQNEALPGFAIASPQLVLGGGNRQLIIASDGISQLIEHFQQSGNHTPLTIWLTGEKGWIKVSQNATDKLKGLLDGDKFNAEISIDEPVYGFRQVNDNTNGIVIYLPVSADAVVPFDEKQHQGYAYKTGWPVMQVMLNPGFDIAESEFSRFSFLHFSILVKVGSMNGDSQFAAANVFTPQLDGLKKLILQNDDQVLPLGKAFNPFTFQPSAGKSFYIGSEEIFNKPIQKLSVNIRSTQENLVHSVELFLLKNKQWVAIPAKDGKNVFSYRELAGDVLLNYFRLNQISILDRNPIQDFSTLDIATLKGFLRLDSQPAANQGEIFVNVPPQQLLAQYEMKEVSLSYTSELLNLEDGIDQFFHVYPFGVAEIRLRKIYSKPDDEVILKTAALETKGDAVSGSAGTDSANKHQEIVRKASVADDSSGIDGRNKLLPQFTYTDYFDLQKRRESYLKRSDGAKKVSFAPAASDAEDGGKPETIKGMERMEPPAYYNNFIIPEIADRKVNQYFGGIQEEGLLYIGLSGAKPLQSVSMLFQFAEGSAIDEDNDPPMIHWSYLSENQWVPLPDANLITDGTYGFQTTGIIKISIPKDASDDNTIVTPGLHWLRASVTENANRVPMLINIVTQAVLATFFDQQNSTEHYANVLPAGNIAKLKVPVAQIGKVAQPFASFDGKAPEVGREYYTRVSERLRHKHRAITAWDYEHLILDRFPSIYKVKCVTHTDPNCLCRKTTPADGTEAVCCGPQVAPGHVLLVPVANLKYRNGVDPLQPKTARRVLIDMVNYIKPLISPFVKVYAKNPVYEQIIVSFKVKFYSGADIGFYLKQLNDEIVHYLTPWAFDENATVAFGQKVYASSIINFIEERTYVDFITDFFMGVCKEGCCPAVDPGIDDRPDVPAVEVINSFSNCADVEDKFSEQTGQAGFIVATPSTPRSILVSAPRHVIIPYEAPPQLSPCAERQQRAKAVKGVGGISGVVVGDIVKTGNSGNPSVVVGKVKDNTKKATGPVLGTPTPGGKQNQLKLIANTTNVSKKAVVTKENKKELIAKDALKGKAADSKSNIIKPLPDKKKVASPVNKKGISNK